MSLIKKPSELVNAPCYKVLVYGQPGLGKTTVGISAPNPVLLDFDGGAHRVNGAHQCPTLPVTSWDEVIQVLNDGELMPFGTIVIDTAGKMLDYMSEYITRNDQKMKKRDGSLSLQGFGVRKNMFINFLRQIQMMGKHLVFIAHEREDKDGEKRFIRPEIGGSSGGDLIKELDLVGYMSADGFKRTITWNPSDTFYAKNACNLPQTMVVPSILDAYGMPTAANDFMTSVFDKYTAFLGQQRELRRKYEAMIERAKVLINDIKDADSANALAEKFSAAEPIWDSKLQIDNALRIKCNSLGLSIDVNTGKYGAA